MLRNRLGDRLRVAAAELLDEFAALLPFCWTNRTNAVRGRFGLSAVYDLV